MLTTVSEKDPNKSHLTLKKKKREIFGLWNTIDVHFVYSQICKKKLVKKISIGTCFVIKSNLNCFVRVR